MQLVIVTILLLSATILLLLIDVAPMKLAQRQSIFFILLLLLTGCVKVAERGKATLTSHTVRLPIVQKDVTITIPPAPTPTIQKLVTPTNTRPANPYYPIIKTLIDTNGEVGDVVVNSKTNVAYAADNQQFLLKIANGIPDFDHRHQLPSGIKQLLFDEDNNRLYAMSRIYVDMITEGVAVIENDQLQGYVPFPGRVRGMVFDPTRHWVYVYGIPNKESNPELIDSNLGVLMIIEGTRVIETIKPWDVRVMQATADPVHGHIYFSSQYLGPQRPDTDTTYGRVTILDGENEIGMFEELYGNLNSLFFNPTYNSIYAFTFGWREDSSYVLNKVN